MPTFRITAPDGRTYNVTGPEGSTKEQALAQVQAQHSAASSVHDEIAAKVAADPITQGALDPAADMSGFERFVAGYGKAGSDLVRGVGQKIGQGVDFFSPTSPTLSGLITGEKPKSTAAKLGLPTEADIDESKRLEAPLMKYGAAKAGNLIGNVIDTAPAMLVPGANTVAGSAVVGGLIGGLQPTGTGESSTQNILTGAGFGAGGNLIAKGAGALWRAGKAIAEPFTAAGPQKIAGRTLQRFASDPSTIAGATGKQSITGAFPTLAEETGDVGIARLQDALRAADPSTGNALATRASANNAARVAKLEEMAGANGARDFAAANRAGTAQPMYEDAFKVVPDASALSPEQARTMQTLMRSPAVKEAQKYAQTIASNRGTNVGPSNASGSVEGLHNMKLAMDDQIATARQQGLTNKASSIEAAQKQLVSLIESLSPEYKTARTVYAQMSKPVNQMDIAAKLAEKGLSRGTDLASGSRVINRNALIAALDNEPNLIKQATGRDLGKLEDVMSPEQMNMIGAIRNEADRAGAVAAAGNGPGSATAQRLASRNILSQIVSPNVVPAGAKPNLAQKAGQAIADNTLANTIVGKATNWMYSGIAEPRIQEALAKAVLSPGEAKAALAAAAQQKVRLPSALMQRLTQQASVLIPVNVERQRSVTNP
jgi:hypothetical protein